MTSQPTGVQLLCTLPRDVLAVVHYTDGASVRVRRRGEARGRWRCGEHGPGADCHHVQAVGHALAAHRALTDHNQAPIDRDTDRPDKPAATSKEHA